MGAVLIVESNEAVRLAQQLSELTGQSVSVAVTEALAGHLAQAKKRRDAELLADELVAIGKRCAATLRGPLNSADHADLYGEDGLPA